MHWYAWPLGLHSLSKVSACVCVCVWRGACGKCEPCTGMLGPSVCILLVKFMHYKSKTRDRDMCVSQFSTFSIFIIIAILSKYFPTVDMCTYHPDLEARLSM